jgi:hypothetical protein
MLGSLRVMLLESFGARENEIELITSNPELHEKSGLYSLASFNSKENICWLTSTHPM